MDDYDVHHLAVINSEKFVGIISKNDLADFDETVSIAALKDHLLKVSVMGSEHFLASAKLASRFEISIIPVVNESGDLLGVIAQKNLIQAFAEFYNMEEPGGIIVLEIDKKHFSFGEISRLIETNDAYITQLNTSPDRVSGLLNVTIKINKLEISDIIGTLQRYDYSIKYYFGEELYENELKENYDLLMTYLNI
jgi:CBS domain-containing protein